MMKLKVDNTGLCVLYSAAMLFDVEPADILRWLDLERPRALHIQEVQNFAFGRDKILGLVERRPVDTSGRKYRDQLGLIMTIIMTESGLLMTDNHCCAFKKGTVYDPKGYIYNVSTILAGVEEIWILSRLK